MYNKKKDQIYKTPEELKLPTDVSAGYSKIVDTLKGIDVAIEKSDEECKKILDNHEKQFLLAYRVKLY